MNLDLGTILLGGIEAANFKLPDPELLQFYEDLNDNHVWIDDDISYESCQHTIKWLLAADRKDINDPIYIHIMSGGGELDIMFAIYDLLKNMRRPIITINEGRCHSAAFLIFLGGDTRLMRKYATFVAHEGSAGMGGTYKEVQQATEAYKKSVDHMRDIISSETSITRDQLRDHFDKETDWHIDYEQAKEFGIVREVVLEGSVSGGKGNAYVLSAEKLLTLPGYAEV